ncbi:MAG: SMP-30/gluconolactonase/LRE family protein [bacterium]
MSPATVTKQFLCCAYLMMKITSVYSQSFGVIHRVDPRLNQLIPSHAKLEKLAEGFEWTEGPLWIPNENSLLFTDIPKNTIYKWKAGEGLSVYLRPAGYVGEDPPGIELGSNGLILSPNGQLVMCDHGNRCISQLNAQNFTKKILADKYEGKRLNSPNDGIFKSNGDFYFTDPPYGLAGQNKDSKKELGFNGVYRLSKDGKLTLLTMEFTFPNGIAFSPDEKTLYVAQSDPEKAIWKAFEVRDDGTIANGKVLFDATPWVKQGKKGLPDGLKVDRAGFLYATGPGGVIVFSPEGKHLGTIETGEATSNCAFGDDGSMLYITADMYLCRIALNTIGKM